MVTETSRGGTARQCFMLKALSAVAGTSVERAVRVTPNSKNEEKDESINLPDIRWFATVITLNSGSADEVERQRLRSH